MTSSILEYQTLFGTLPGIISRIFIKEIIVKQSRNCILWAYDKSLWCVH
jgi:hypothetical protein